MASSILISAFGGPILLILYLIHAELKRISGLLDLKPDDVLRYVDECDCGAGARPSEEHDISCPKAVS
jgi:hypothetical protein